MLCGRESAHGAMVVGSIPHGEPTELVLLQSVLHSLFNKGYVLSYLWDGAYKRSFAANQKE